MDRIELPDGTRTTRLGFGCAQLHGGWGLKRSVRLVHAALDAGITHFDTAPSYGMGSADDALRQALAGRRASVTVTTKVGIGRPKAQGALGLARGVARPLLSLAPALRARLGRAAYAASTVRGQFAVSQMRASLEESLRRLGTEHVDLLLLHQVSAADVGDELLRYLEDRRAAGTIGAYGVGTTWDDAEAIARTYPALSGVVQAGWSVLDAPLSPRDGQLVVTHGALRRLEALRNWLLAEDARLSRMERAAGMGLREAKDLGAAMLGGAYAANTGGIVLVSTRQPQRIVRNAAIADDGAMREAGRKLAAALRADPEAPHAG